MPFVCMKMKYLLLYSFVVLLSGACSVQEKDKNATAGDDADLTSDLVYETAMATAVDTVMVKDLMVEKHFVRLPDTPKGYRAQALLEVVMAADDAQILPFVQEHYAPDFIQQVPQNDHKALLKHLQQQTKEGEVTSFEDLEDAYRIGISSSHTKLGYTLDVYFEPEAPYRISGVRVL